MKKLFMTIALVGVAQFAMAQAPVDEAFKKDVLKVVEMSGSAAQINVAKKQVLAMVPAEKQAAFLVEFEASLPALYDKIAEVYMSTYTKQDIKDMIAFYNSPVGKKINEKAAEIAEKSQEAGKSWGQSLQAILMKYVQQ
jgi:hypothetical protein